MQIFPRFKKSTNQGVGDITWSLPFFQTTVESRVLTFVYNMEINFFQKVTVNKHQVALNRQSEKASMCF